MVVYIWTKFGADWLILVDGRVYTRKCGRTTDGRTDDGLRAQVRLKKSVTVRDDGLLSEPTTEG